jgi:hypothetical protein
MANRRPRPATRPARRSGSAPKSAGTAKPGRPATTPSGSTGATATRGRTGAEAVEAPVGARPTPGPARPSRIPPTLYAAAAVAALEALAGLGVGGWLTVEAVVQRPVGLAIAASAGVFVLAVGVGLGFLAWGLFNGRRWSRGPTVATQLIMLPIGYEFLSGATTAAGVVMLVAAVLTLGLVLAPPSTAVFRG